MLIRKKKQQWKRDKEQTALCVRLDRDRKPLPCLVDGLRVPLVSSITFLTAAPRTAVASDVESTASIKDASN